MSYSYLTDPRIKRIQGFAWSILRILFKDRFSSRLWTGSVSKNQEFRRVGSNSVDSDDCDYCSCRSLQEFRSLDQRIRVWIFSLNIILILISTYSFAVATVMISTATLIAIQIRYVKRLPIIVALAFFVFYGFIDGLFWGASLKKVPQGAWVPLMLGGVV